MWVRVRNKRNYSCDGARDQPSSSSAQAGTEGEMGLLASGQCVGEDPGEVHLGYEVLSMPLNDVAKQNSSTTSDLHKRKSTRALPLTPKA